MKPYYEHAGITIYHGDCREVMGGVRAGAIVADPPYGISLDTSGARPGGTAHVPVYGDDVAFDPSWLLALRVPTVLWGANHYASRLPDVRGWLAWDKATRNGLNLKQAEIEFAWTNCTARPRAFRHMWSGAYRDSERGTKFHPTQKPALLMSWCLGFIPSSSQPVVDPFCGSGPVLVAAKDLGRRAIGIEIEERYCEIAAKRLSQETLNLPAPYQDPDDEEAA